MSSMSEVNSNGTILQKKDENKIIAKAILRISHYWNLTDQESADIFNLPIDTWNLIKSENFSVNLNEDNKNRASLIIGLFQRLRLFFNGPLSYGWTKRHNSDVMFSEKTPIQFMIEGGIPAMSKTRQYIDGMRSGL